MSVGRSRCCSGTESRIGVIGHDVGGAVIQSLARKAPHRLARLFLFDFGYPGIGFPHAEPGRLNSHSTRCR